MQEIEKWSLKRGDYEAQTCNERAGQTQPHTTIEILKWYPDGADTLILFSPDSFKPQVYDEGIWKYPFPDGWKVDNDFLYVLACAVRYIDGNVTFIPDYVI